MFDVSMAVFESFEEPVGNSIDEATAVMLKREGARAVLEEIFDWEPQSVKNKEADDDA